MPLMSIFTKQIYSLHRMDNAKEVGVWKKFRKNQSIEGPRAKPYHYLWDLNDGGSGFILYKKKTNRYKMYEDTNGNGIRDKKIVSLVRENFLMDFDYGIYP